MNPATALKTLGASMAAGMVLGVAIGGLLGLISPGLVVGMLGEAVVLDGPVRSGIGLGIVNGLFLGFATGVLLVIVGAIGKRDRTSE